MAETTPLNDLLADLECQAAMFRRLVSDWGDEPHGELRLYCDNTARPQLAELEAQIAALRASTSEARICEATAANTILAALQDAAWLPISAPRPPRRRPMESDVKLLGWTCVCGGSIPPALDACPRCKRSQATAVGLIYDYANPPAAASQGAGTPPLCEGLVELDRLIANQSRSVSARRQLAETESLPALKASKARNGHPAVRAMPANPRHGKQHRSILAIEEEELLALQSARADYASQSTTIATLQQHLADAVVTARYQSDVTRQADDAREKAEQERDAVIVTAADTIFTTTQTWIEKLAAAQAENAGLREERDLWREWWECRHGEAKPEWDRVASPRQLAIFANELAARRATPTPPQERPS
jgi:hypothetical protein